MNRFNVKELIEASRRIRDAAVGQHRLRMWTMEANAGFDSGPMFRRAHDLSQWLELQLRSLAHLPGGKSEFFDDISTVLVQDMLHEQTESLRRLATLETLHQNQKAQQNRNVANNVKTLLSH